jgi:heme oxygenase
VILHQLKDATRAQHTALETAVGEQLGFGQTPVTLERYKTLLQRFWGFYAPLEACIWTRPEWQAQPFQIEQRSKAPRLLHDLQVLGAAQKPLSQCDELPIIAEWPQVLGCLYVLEGATLGGQIIARHLKRELNIDAESGTAFFNSYGAEVGPMWQAFGALISSQVQTPHDVTIAVESAQQTFALFERWLNDESAMEVLCVEAGVHHV